MPGHEVAGLVEEVGEGFEWPQERARVSVPWLYSSRGICEQRIRGEEILCPWGQATEVTQDGGYAGFMLAPAAYVAPSPDALDLAEAAPLMTHEGRLRNRVVLTVHISIHEVKGKDPDQVGALLVEAAGLEPASASAPSVRLYERRSRFSFALLCEPGRRREASLLSVPQEPRARAQGVSLLR